MTKNQVILTSGILGLILILYYANKKKSDEKDKIDLREGVPQNCVDGFDVDGYEYKIENGNYIKQKN